MTQEEKMKALKLCLREHCSWTNCYECKFEDKQDAGRDGYECGIRDNEGNIPYYDKWNMKVALGFEKPYKQIFSTEIENAIMNHFERVE